MFSKKKTFYNYICKTKIKNKIDLDLCQLKHLFMPFKNARLSAVAMIEGTTEEQHFSHCFGFGKSSFTARQFQLRIGRGLGGLPTN